MHRESDIHIDANTAVTRWRGERMDYSIATDILLTRDRRARNVPAETRLV